MKKIVFSFLFSISILFASSQDVTALIEEGIALHDEGKFDEAIKKYDEAIAINPNRYLAYYEKIFSQIKAGKYEDCIELSKTTLKKFPDSTLNGGIYINYGTAYDMLKMPDHAIKIYDEGIKKYPKEGLLYFNKAITLYGMGKMKEAMEIAEKSVKTNPLHASSHNMISKLAEKNRVYSMLASLCLLAIEPTGQRAKAHLALVEAAINANVEKKDDKTINITMFMPDDKGKKEDNNFRTVEVMMGLTAAASHTDEHKNETRIERMKRNLESIFAMLSESKKEKGFGWVFYAPFFHDLKDKGYLDTYTHLIYASSDDGDNEIWLENNEVKLKEFTQWLKNYWK